MLDSTLWRRSIRVAVAACVVALAVSGGVAGGAGGTTLAGVSRATDVGFAPASSAEGVALGSAKRKRTPVPTATRAAGATSTVVVTATSAPSTSATATSVAIATSTRAAATSTSAQTTTPVAPTSTPEPSGSGPTVGGCAMFPSNNPWNQDISSMPVDANSATYISSINATGGNGFLHADFGGGGAYGIPYIVVPADEPLRPINFTAYGDESDPGPYPIPQTAPIEGGGTDDAHVLAVQQGACKLYEMFNAHPSGSGWNADSGAVFDLSSNALRPDGWTSADAAGLPILAGLVRYDEVQAGAIQHALRFTVGTVQRAWVHPATHYGTTTDTTRPPYGTRLRLKASFDVSPYHGESRVVLEALKRYGMIVADQGSSWFITGAADARWDDTDLNQLKTVPGTAFEMVQLGTIIRP